MSGYASFAEFSKDSVIEIPCVDATPETLEGLGVLFNPIEFDERSVTYATVKDLRTGRDMVIPRKEVVGKFKVWQRNDFCCARNHAVKSGLYKVAKIDSENMYKFYFREVNYHPESSQIIAPDEKSPFILILGLEPNQLKAYVFDGSLGFEIFPGVWHQPPLLHYHGSLTFSNKQAESHICVVYDSVNEDKGWMMFDYA